MKISQKILSLVLITILCLVGSTVYGFYIQLKATLEEEVELGQQKNLEIAAILLKRDFPDVKLTFDEKAGDLVKIESTNNLYFYNHTMIDEIGTVTGETATVFLWDEKTQDYWRKTTNIIKDDGKRAIGTPLGKTGKVYPIIKSGKTFR